jgi:hypothetical protein
LRHNGNYGEKSIFKIYQKIKIAVESLFGSSPFKEGWRGFFAKSNKFLSTIF